MDGKMCKYKYKENQDVEVRHEYPCICGGFILFEYVQTWNIQW